jgi:hypothetical protein
MKKNNLQLTKEDEQILGIAIELAGMIMEGMVSRRKTKTFHVERIAKKVHRLIEARARQSAKEICICAAVKTTTGKIIRGHRHGDCIKAIVARGLKPSRSANAQGFVTSKNRFVSRRMGRRLQDMAGIKSASPEGYMPGTLFSEDLY